MQIVLRFVKCLLGGSGSIEEIYAKTVEITGLSEDVLAQLHDPEKSSQTEVAYRLAWARTYLRKYGAPPIDLIDGDELAEKLKELGLGIKKELIERISVDEPWFLTAYNVCAGEGRVKSKVARMQRSGIRGGRCHAHSRIPFHSIQATLAYRSATMFCHDTERDRPGMPSALISTGRMVSTLKNG